MAGFQSSLIYKGIELDFLFHFSKQIAQTPEFSNTFFQEPGTFASELSNQPVAVLNRWRNPGDKSVVKKFSTSQSAGIGNVSSSDAGFTDASFIRLKKCFNFLQFI